MTTKVYRVEVLVVDHDGLGADGIKEVLENQRYPNWCISPYVMSAESRDVEWSDEHPLNQRTTMRDFFLGLFGGAQ